MSRLRGGKAHCEAGSLRDRMMVIESGIGPDDWVIVKGLQRARPGIMVTPRRLDKKDVAGSQSPPPVTKTAGRGKTT